MPNLEHYAGREQGFVKHAIIEKYLTRFAIKIGSQWDSIVYLDAFAGPWGSVADDLSDTSFCIALEELRKGTETLKVRFNRDVPVRAFLIEKNKAAFKKLSEFGESKKQDGFEVKCINEEFESAIPSFISEITPKKNERSFLFALIDPKGWTGLSMDVIAPLLKGRSTEVLVNVMTYHIKRFIDAENCHSSYEKFFGREGVREIIAATPKEQRADAVVREYCRSLRQICGYEYLSSAVVLQQDKQGIKYFMVYGTNSPVGMKVFKEAEAHAARLQDQIKEEQALGDQIGLFSIDQGPRVSDELRLKYKTGAFQRVEELFHKQDRVAYSDVFCKAMAMPLVTEQELLEHIEGHPNLELSLDGERRKKPKVDNKADFVVRTAK